MLGGVRASSWADEVTKVGGRNADSFGCSSEGVAAELQQLRAVLDTELPPKVLDRNLLVATWNVREFGGLTEKWRAAPTDSPKRAATALTD